MLLVSKVRILFLVVHFKTWSQLLKRKIFKRNKVRFLNFLKITIAEFL
jgi:hypothetical protein